MERSGLRIAHELARAARPLSRRSRLGRSGSAQLRHGVRSCLEYAKTFDLARARALSNPALAPHLAFVDMGGHGYAKVRLSGDDMRTEFVCIPRPIARSERPDGGPLRYRVVHVAKLWRACERPQLTQHVLEGDPGLAI
jgi:alkaline phosphatase D